MYCSRCGSQKVEGKLDREQVGNHFSVSTRMIDYYRADEGENDLIDQEFVAELNVYTCQVCGHKFYEDNIYKIKKVEFVEYGKDGQECGRVETPHPISIFYSINTAKDSLENYYKGFGEWRFDGNKFICNYARDGVAFAIIAQVENKG